MWKPSQLGEVVAERRLLARGKNRRKESVTVKFGIPVHSAIKQDPWWCPVEISGVGKSRLFAAAGEDSVQSLILALRYAEAELNLRYRRQEFEWLGDAERPIFFHTHMIDMYQGAIDNLLKALRRAISMIDNTPDPHEWRKCVAEIRQVEARRGFIGPKRRAQRRRRAVQPKPEK